MFSSARIKLTAWYLLIIMFISLAFSLFIYQLLSFEINRFARAQRFRIERNFFGGTIITPSPVDLDLINDSQRRLALSLVVINGGILAVSGVLSFFLAGRTLEPIRVMVEDQNRFISDSSHELRTPLAALKSSLEVNLRDKRLRLSDAKKLIADSITDVDKLQSLSDGLLALTRFDPKNNQITFTPVPLVEIVTESVRKVAPLAKIKKIVIKTDVQESHVTGDKYRLVDLLVILLDNAIKYSPDGKKIFITSLSQNKSTILSVKDQGIGIDKKDLPHIFDRFYRSDRSRSAANVSGFGLGLSIAKKIADNHHLQITVDSTPGQGSTFQLIFKNHS